MSSVPTDALANKLFGAPEPSSIARSLPTTVPDSPNYRSARTPRTPRTPHRKDQTMTPRFYPVVKESRPVDAKVWWLPRENGTLSCRGLKTTLSKHFELVIDPLNSYICSVTLQTPRKRKTRHSSNPPMECHVGWVMDSREHRSRTASVRWDSSLWTLPLDSTKTDMSCWILQDSIFGTINFLLFGENSDKM